MWPHPDSRGHKHYLLYCGLKRVACPSTFPWSHEPLTNVTNEYGTSVHMHNQSSRQVVTVGLSRGGYY